MSTNAKNGRKASQGRRKKNTDKPASEERATKDAEAIDGFEKYHEAIAAHRSELRLACSVVADACNTLSSGSTLYSVWANVTPLAGYFRACSGFHKTAGRGRVRNNRTSPERAPDHGVSIQAVTDWLDVDSTATVTRYIGGGIHLAAWERYTSPCGSGCTVPEQMLALLWAQALPVKLAQTIAGLRPNVFVTRKLFRCKPDESAAKTNAELMKAAVEEWRTLAHSHAMSTDQEYAIEYLQGKLEELSSAYKDVIAGVGLSQAIDGFDSAQFLPQNQIDTDTGMYLSVSRSEEEYDAAIAAYAEEYAQRFGQIAAPAVAG